jgi:hypothetical protein
MLSAMLNRATMRVADTTEVSGRVTADSKEKQTMKPTILRCLALAIAFWGLYLALPDCGLAQNNQDQNDQGTGINLRVPNGTYPFHDSWVPVSRGPLKKSFFTSVLFLLKSLLMKALHPAGLEPATLVTKLKLASARFGGQRFGLALC